MLKPGIYRAENSGSIFDAYEIDMQVRETGKSYIFTLLNFNTRYGATQIEDMFRAAKRLVIQKDRGKHGMQIWSETDFTLYPYRVGVPYYFRLREEN